MGGQRQLLLLAVGARASPTGQGGALSEYARIWRGWEEGAPSRGLERVYALAGGRPQRWRAFAELRAFLAGTAAGSAGAVGAGAAVGAEYVDTLPPPPKLMHLVRWTLGDAGTGGAAGGAGDGAGGAAGAQGAAAAGDGVGAQDAAAAGTRGGPSENPATSPAPLLLGGAFANSAPLASQPPTCLVFREHVALGLPLLLRRKCVSAAFPLHFLTPAAAAVASRVCMRSPAASLPAAITLIDPHCADAGPLLETAAALSALPLARADFDFCSPAVPHAFFDTGAGPPAGKASRVRVCAAGPGKEAAAAIIGRWGGCGDPRIFFDAEGLPLSARASCVFISSITVRAAGGKADAVPALIHAVESAMTRQRPLHAYLFVDAPSAQYLGREGLFRWHRVWPAAAVGSNNAPKKYAILSTAGLRRNGAVR